MGGSHLFQFVSCALLSVVMLWPRVCADVGDDVMDLLLSGREAAMDSGWISGHHWVSGTMGTLRTRRQTQEGQGKKGRRSHMKPCTEKEKKQTACINGECYALQLSEPRSAFCHCPEIYEGSRCEKLAPAEYAYIAELKKAAIISGVVVGAIIIIIGLSIFISYRKGKLKRQKQAQTNRDADAEQNETASLAAKENIAV